MSIQFGKPESDVENVAMERSKPTVKVTGFQKHAASCLHTE